MITIERVDPADVDLRAAVTGVLGAHAVSLGLPYAPVNLALILRRGEIVEGGLLGYANWEWLRIEILAVSETLRGQGFGRRLMEDAEAFARDQGCRGAWVDTFTFQAPGFYERLGYQRFGELPDYPHGHARVFYRKRL